VFREVVRRVTSINPYLDQHQDQDNHPSSSSTATTFMICSYSRKTFSQVDSFLLLILISDLDIIILEFRLEMVISVQ